MRKVINVEELCRLSELNQEQRSSVWMCVDGVLEKLNSKFHVVEVRFEDGVIVLED